MNLIAAVDKNWAIGYQVLPSDDNRKSCRDGKKDVREFSGQEAFKEPYQYRID